MRKRSWKLRRRPMCNPLRVSIHREDGRYHRWRCGSPRPMLGLPGRLREAVLQTIMCAVDESWGAAEAIAVAAGLSGGLGLRLVLAHVVDGDRPTNGANLSVVQRRRGGQRLLERVARNHSLESTADRRAEVGDRASELSRIAAEEAVVVIVVGSRGRYRRGRGRLSRLSAELRSTAPCPVVVVPPRQRR